MGLSLDQQQACTGIAPEGGCGLACHPGLCAGAKFECTRVVPLPQVPRQTHLQRERFLWCACAFQRQCQAIDL